MRQKARNGIRLSLLAVMVAGVLPVASPNIAFGQALDAGTLNREIQRDVKKLRQDERSFPAAEEKKQAEPKATTDAPAVAEGATGNQPIPVWETERMPPEDQVMATPFRRIYIRSSILRTEVQNIVRGEIIEKNQLRPGALASIRSKVWDLFLQHNRLASISFKIIPVAGSDSDSYMRVVVDVISRNRILIEDKTKKGLGDATREQIQNSVAQSFDEGQILDLEGLDARLKNRLRLGDYDMQISLAPVNPTSMDVKVVVSDKNTDPMALMLQYDNSGTRSFGRDRVMAAGSFNQLGLPGDRLDVTLMKSVDIADLDGHGVAFGRADYDVPLSAYGVRLKGWGSAMHYDAVARTASNSKANGEAFEFGLGVMKPLLTTKSGLIDVQTDFIEKFVRDRFDKNTLTSDKQSHNGRVKVSGATMLDETQVLRGAITATAGDVDLSGLQSALASDRAGPKANGIYTKLEGEAAWQMGWSENQRGDVKINARGQASAMNLDSMEKFSLGGSSGLRAFGSGEASGDMGGLAQFETGYRVWSALRASVFYDVGVIWRNYDQYETNATSPNNYILQDVGFGLGYNIGGLGASLLFAQQLGPNPGLSASGRDADNGTRESRILTSVSYAF